MGDSGQISSGDLKLFNSAEPAYLKFFAFADKNQMPLRQVNVDWGDGTYYQGSGSYRNHRGYAQQICQAKTCHTAQTSWLHSPDDAGGLWSRVAGAQFLRQHSGDADCA